MVSVDDLYGIDRCLKFLMYNDVVGVLAVVLSLILLKNNIRLLAIYHQSIIIASILMFSSLVVLAFYRVVLYGIHLDTLS